MPQGYVQPVNQILVDIEGMVSHEYEVGANATAVMLPGCVVIYDTVDYAVKEAGIEADNPLGVLEVKSDGLITTVPVVGEQRTVIERGKVLIRLENASAAVAPGDPLVCAADGRMILQATGAIGTQGAPCAYALEIADPAGGETLCLAFFTGQREAAPAA